MLGLMRAVNVQVQFSSLTAPSISSLLACAPLLLLMSDPAAAAVAKSEKPESSRDRPKRQRQPIAGSANRDSEADSNADADATMDEAALSLSSAPQWDRRTRLRSAADAAASADYARWLALSPAQRCFTDGLAVAFSHLTLGELLTAARSCKSWREGAKRVKSLGPGQDSLLDVFSRTEPEQYSIGSRLLSFWASPFNHHIHKLHGMRSVCRLADIHLLALLPRITHIGCMQVQLRPLSLLSSSDARRFLFPLHLKSVSLKFLFCGNDHPPSRSLAAVLDGLSACGSLTEVKLAAAHQEPWSLTPLLELKRLRRLTLKGWPEEHYGAEHMGVVKQIPTLRSLQLLPPYDDFENDEELDAPWLASLCQPPHRMQRLTKLNLSEVWVFQEEILHLQHLPALTSLKPFFFSIAALAGLTQFPHLRHLRLSLAPEVEVVMDQPLVPDDMLDDGFPRASLFLPHLRCGGLQSLSVDRCVFSEVEAEALCLLLPQLTDLAMVDVDWPSLHPLRHLTQLSQLSIDLALRAALNFSIQHLQSLQQLRFCGLTDIHPPLDAATVAALHPPSALVPSLKEFIYTPRSQFG